MGPRRHPHSRGQVGVDKLVAFAAGWRGNGEQRDALAIERDFEFMRLLQALQFFVAISHQPDLHFVLAGGGEVIGDQHAAAGPERQPFDVNVLGDIGPDAERLGRRRSSDPPHRHLADLLGSGQIPAHPRWRQSDGGDVIEPVTRFISR